MSETRHDGQQEFSGEIVIDKNESSLDGQITIGHEFVSTPDGNAVIAKAIAVGEDEAVFVEVDYVVMRSTGAEAGRGKYTHGFRRDGSGNITAIGSATSVAVDDSSGTPALTVAANTTDQTMDITVTGEASKVFKWALRYTTMTVKAA